jgi:hypothetical protein
MMQNPLYGNRPDLPDASAADIVVHESASVDHYLGRHAVVHLAGFLTGCIIDRQLLDLRPIAPSHSVMESVRSVRKNYIRKWIKRNKWFSAIIPVALPRGLHPYP